YPGGGFARVGPDRLELARRIEHEKAQAAVVCGLQMVPLASAEIDHIARLYRQLLTVRPSFAATAQDVHEGGGTLMMIARCGGARWIDHHLNFDCRCLAQFRADQSNAHPPITLRLEDWFACPVDHRENRRGVGEALIEASGIGDFDVEQRRAIGGRYCGRKSRRQESGMGIRQSLPVFVLELRLARQQRCSQASDLAEGSNRVEAPAASVRRSSSTSTLSTRSGVNGLTGLKRRKQIASAIAPIKVATPLSDRYTMLKGSRRVRCPQVRSPWSMPALSRSPNRTERWHKQC